MSRAEILGRYRQLRVISTHHHGAALKFVPREVILDHAKRLGLLAHPIGTLQ